MPQNGSKLPPMVGAMIDVRVTAKDQTENLSLSTALDISPATVGRDWAIAHAWLNRAPVPTRRQHTQNRYDA